MSLLAWGEIFQVFPSVNCCRYSTVGRWDEGIGQAGIWGLSFPCRGAFLIWEDEVLCLLLGQVLNAF